MNGEIVTDYSKFLLMPLKVKCKRCKQVYVYMDKGRLRSHECKIIDAIAYDIEEIHLLTDGKENSNE